MRTASRLPLVVALLFAIAPAASAASKTPSKPAQKQAQQKQAAAKPQAQSQPQARADSDERVAEAVRALSAVLTQDPRVAGDAAERFVDRIWREGSTGGYVSPKARKDPRTLSHLEALVKERVSDQLARADGARTIAQLYFVMGAGEKIPAWAESSPQLKGALGGFRADGLRARLKPWTEPPIGGKAPIASGKLGLKRQDEWVAAFLADAASHAERLLGPARAPVPDDESVNRLEDKLDEKGSRQPQHGEFKRFEKVKELIPPPLPKISEVVPEHAKPVTDPILVPMDKVIHPIETLSPEKPAAAPASSNP